jgi:hypothetical protein
MTSWANRKTAAEATIVNQSCRVRGANPMKRLMRGVYIAVMVKPIEITIDHNIVLLLQKFLLNRES